MTLFLLILFILVFFIVIYMYTEGQSLEFTEEEIQLPIDMEKKSILFLSDIHRRPIDEKISSLPPFDYVIIGGDLTEKGAKEDTVKINLSMLSKLGHVLFVWGNNDYEFGVARLTTILKEHNVTCLNNQSIRIDEEKNVWSIAGIEDYGTERANLVEALANTKGPVLLISHNPDAVDLLQCMEGNIPYLVMLSGHTHGGQIRLGPFGIAERGGWKRKNGIPVFVSNGFGTRKIPLRLGAKAQCHFITIIGNGTIYLGE